MANYGQQTPRNTSTGAAANGWLVVVLIVLVAVLMFRAVSDTLRNRPDYTPRTVTVRGELGADEKSTIQVFELASPSVVFVRSKGTQRVFYGQPQDTELSSGTGFVWDESGHIVTNFHVVRDAALRDQTELEVQFADGTTLPAQFVGAVYKHDIAILKVESPPSQLIPITIGRSSDLKVGQNVLAIGNPFGYDRTLSTGVIGGLNRSVPTQQETNEFLDGLIQTDAAINPGNSGGPLLDSAGLLIGVNTAIVSTSGASAGLGFAVPVDDVLESVTEILNQYSKRPPAALGIGILDEDSARNFGIPAEIFERGLIVRNIYPNSGAAEAGLLPTRLGRYQIMLGDQIIALDGQRVATAQDLQSAISTRKPGDEVVLDIIRGTQTGKVTVRLKPPMLLL